MIIYWSPTKKNREGTSTVIQIIIIPADDNEPVHPHTLNPKALTEMQALVGGWLEAVTLQSATIFMNEEGKLQGLPPNRRATLLWAGLASYPVGDVICGDVFVSGPADRDGEMTRCPEVAVALAVSL